MNHIWVASVVLRRDEAMRGATHTISATATGFCAAEEIDAEISAMKIAVNERARTVGYQFLKEFTV